MTCHGLVRFCPKLLAIPLAIGDRPHLAGHDSYIETALVDIEIAKAVLSFVYPFFDPGP